MLNTKRYVAKVRDLI